MNNEEILILTDNARARVLRLQPGKATALHYHTEITDHMLGVSGEIVVHLKDPEEKIVLTPGKRCTIPPGRRHQVVNTLTDEISEYLLIQGVGRYDFITADK